MGMLDGVSSGLGDGHQNIVGALGRIARSGCQLAKNNAHPAHFGEFRRQDERTARFYGCPEA